MEEVFAYAVTLVPTTSEVHRFLAEPSNFSFPQLCALFSDLINSPSEVFADLCEIVEYKVFPEASRITFKDKSASLKTDINGGKLYKAVHDVFDLDTI